MSQTLRRAAETPARASISTPVLPTEVTMTSATTASARSSKATSTPVIDMGVAHGDRPRRLLHRLDSRHPRHGDGRPPSPPRRRGSPELWTASGGSPRSATALRPTAGFSVISTIPPRYSRRPGLGFTRSPPHNHHALVHSNPWNPLEGFRGSSPVGSSR